MPPRTKLYPSSLDPIADDVLDRWAAGEGAMLIAKTYGRTNRMFLRKIVLRARKRGDPRAIDHGHLAAGTEGWRKHYRVNRKHGKWNEWVFTP
jgi:hypothetical protein